MSQDEMDRVRWIALSLVPGLGRRGIERLIAQFGTLEAVLGTDAAALQTVTGIGPRLAAAIRDIDLEGIAVALTGWESGGVAIWRHGDAAYPAALHDLPDAPAVLFVRGAVTPEDMRAVAIVGTRRPSQDARQLAARLAGLCAAQGWTVISGLAEGIDTAAHLGALSAGGRTLAVLGCGVNTVYPPQNRALAGRVVAAGALISESAPDASPSAPQLVARNRVISGLSRAVIVVETSENGGSMHAARFANAQGRALFAVRNGSAGTDRLLAQGARAIVADADLDNALIVKLTDLLKES